MLPKLLFRDLSSIDSTSLPQRAGRQAYFAGRPDPGTTQPDRNIRFAHAHDSVCAAPINLHSSIGLRKGATREYNVVDITGYFPNHKLTANALEMYYKLRELRPDLVWIKSKIFELEEALASQVAATTATAGAGGKTYALLAEISKNQQPELSLQFADADASVFGQLFQSPRGGQWDTFREPRRQKLGVGKKLARRFLPQ